MSKHKLRQDDAIFAIRATYGILTEAAERLGVCRQTLYSFAKRHPKVQAAIDEAREVIVDKAVRGLVDCLEERQPWAIALTLKTLGKFRGFFEPQHLTPSGQCRLPQGEAAADGRYRDVPDDDEAEWETPEEADRSDPAAVTADWQAREAELLAGFAAERQTLLARIHELEAATAGLPHDPPEADREVMTELERLARVAEALQQRVGGPSLLHEALQRCKGGQP